MAIYGTDVVIGRYKVEERFQWPTAILLVKDS